MRRDAVVKLTGLPENAVLRVTRGKVIRDLKGRVPRQVLEVVCDPTQPAEYWYAGGHYYFDDPAFGDVVDILDLAYNDEIGLHVAQQSGPLFNPSDGITAVAEGPTNTLFCALNFYCSTGDHIGEGLSVPLGGGRLGFNLLHDPTNPIDADDHKKLISRLGEIVAATDIPLAIEDHGRLGKFHLHVLIIAENDCYRLARELVRDGGRAGFGTGASLIDREIPHLRDLILSQEGI